MLARHCACCARCYPLPSPRSSPRSCPPPLHVLRKRSRLAISSSSTRRWWSWAIAVRSARQVRRDLRPAPASPSIRSPGRERPPDIRARSTCCPIAATMSGKRSTIARASTSCRSPSSRSTIRRPCRSRNGKGASRRRWSTPSCSPTRRRAAHRPRSQRHPPRRRRPAGPSRRRRTGASASIPNPGAAA